MNLINIKLEALVSKPFPVIPQHASTTCTTCTFYILICEHFV